MAHYQTAADVFDGWRKQVLAGATPIRYPIGHGALERIDVGPGLVTLIGGAPGIGKTAFTMQAVIDALRLTPELRVVVCNIEMHPTVLLSRQLGRLSGVDVTAIRNGQLDPAHADRLDQAFNTLEALADRLCFVRPPFDLKNVGAVADVFRADLVVLDYIQRIPAPGKHGDRRSSIDANMNYLRQFADEGMAVLVVSAVARTKGLGGRSSYDGDSLNLASFRESSELEFGADDAFILVPDPKVEETIVLRHLKARYTEPRDVELRFDTARQSFTSLNSTKRSTREKVRAESGLKAVWGRTRAAREDDVEDADEDQ